MRLNQYRNLTRKAEEKVYLRNDRKDPDRTERTERGLKSTLLWVSEVFSNLIGRDPTRIVSHWWRASE